MDGISFEPGTMSSELGIRLLGAGEDGRGIVVMPLTERHLNKLGNAHGGAIFALADMAATAGCIGLGLKCVTAQCSISYLAPGRVGPLKAEAVPVKVGRSLVVFDVVVYDGTGAKIAKSTMNSFVIGKHVREEGVGY